MCRNPAEIKSSGSHKLSSTNLLLHSERKIDQIEERLAGIEGLLKQLISAQTNNITSNTTNTSAAPRSSQPQATPGTPASTGFVDRTPSGSSSSRGDGASIPAKGVDGGRSGDPFEPEDAETFEGNSSLTAHTAFASEFLANAVRKTTIGDGVATNPKFDAALNSLRQLISMQDKSRQRSTSHVWTPGPHFTNPSSDETREPSATTRKQPARRTELKDLPLPPMALVREQLSSMQHGPVPAMLAILYTFIDYEHFADRCRQLYFTTDDSSPSEASFIIVNAGLTYIFFEASLTAATDPAKKACYEEARSMCQHNLEVALSQLSMMMPATGENIEALLMGASFCVDASRASFAWILVSRAAHMCRTLGYHQISSMKDDPPQIRADKALLFWCTYMLDKALSLRLGRASVLQDYDISLPHVTPDARAAYPGKEVLTLWIKHARVMGRIFERLYSPGALRQQPHAATEQVRLLAAEQLELMAETRKLLDEFKDARDAEGRMFALTLKSDEVSYLQTLTLTYRALPPTGTGTGTGTGRSRTFADECIDAARASMRCYQETIDMIDQGGAADVVSHSLKIVYIHWTILYAPFIPFIVVFCLVIETADREGDLRRLADFVRSLETACEFSGAVRKLHRLCQVLYTIAELYVEAKKKSSSTTATAALDGDAAGVVQGTEMGGLLGMGGMDHQDAGMQFDACLSQLGLLPVDDAGMLMGGLQQQQGLEFGDGNTTTAAAATPSGGIGEAVGNGAGNGAGDNRSTNHLEDWFSGNNYMMGLLEEDLSWIDLPMTWPT
ncbi:fungal-specific transcription factor domain protein [Xylariaceae sp. FL0594]|nr:fungal-specific transcription factor domain protein [Xylariaceae sp. FL0594]